MKLAVQYLYTTWKVSKYGVFSGRYFPVFRLKTEIFFINLYIQSECRKIWTRKNSVSGHFSRSDENWLQGGCLWKRVQRCCPYYWLKIKFTLSTLSYLCFVKAEFLKNPRKALRWHLLISAKLWQLFLFFFVPNIFLPTNLERELKSTCGSSSLSFTRNREIIWK